MSAFTDRLYLAWRNAQGKGPAGVRRTAPGRVERYPRHQAKPAIAGAVLTEGEVRSSYIDLVRGSDASKEETLAAPCGQSPPALSLASK